MKLESLLALRSQKYNTKCVFLPAAVTAGEREGAPVPLLKLLLLLESPYRLKPLSAVFAAAEGSAVAELCKEDWAAFALEMIFRRTKE